MPIKSQSLQNNLLNWFEQNGRQHLPWLQNKTHYNVWVSEIMLQQTQVTTVIPYFEKFTARFPNVGSLAQAHLDDVLSHWAGLGYYARARNLHKAAQIIAQEHNGQFPNNFKQVIKLPGIGRSTAAAILASVENQPLAILDGNVKRVLSRFEQVSGNPQSAQTIKKLWQLAEAYTPKNRPADYNQAMMDLGATICTRSRPNCEQCPLNNDCQAFQHRTVEQYPNKKPKQKRSSRERIFFILINNHQQIALYRRQEQGLWGGLWCLPEFADICELNHWLSQHNLDPHTAETWTTQCHQLTHFDLYYTPVIYRTTNHSLNLPNQWHDLAKVSTLGLPKPIKALLEKLDEQHDLLSKTTTTTTSAG